MNTKSKGYLYTASSITAASFMYILTKLVVNSINISSLMGIYFSAAFLIGSVSAKIFIKIDLLDEVKHHIILIVGVSALTIVGAYFWFLSIDRNGAAATSLLAKLQTIFTVAAGVILLGERFTAKAWIAAAGSMIGSMLVVYKDSRIDFLALIWMGIFSASYAFQAYLIRKSASSLNMIAITIWRSFFIALFFLIVSLTKGDFQVPQIKTLMVISVAGVMGAYLSKGFQYLAFRHLPISTVSVMINGESILTLILAALFLGEQFSLINLLGGLLVLISSAYLYLKAGSS